MSNIEKKYRGKAVRIKGSDKEKERSILIALYKADWTYRQISQAIGRGASAVSSVVSRAGIAKPDRGLKLEAALIGEGVDPREFL